MNLCRFDIAYRLLASFSGCLDPPVRIARPDLHIQGVPNQMVFSQVLEVQGILYRNHLRCFA